MIYAYIIANASLYNIPFLFLCFLCHPYIFTIFVEKFYCSLLFSILIPFGIFEDWHDLESIAFPTIYRDGENDFDTIRESQVRPLQYFYARVLSADTIWACHPSHIFWACNIVEALRL